MLLKSIKLTEFRNFKGTQEIIFADDAKENVTVIMGENGSGKTTLAQAFTWCLYGKTDFTDAMVMSKATLQTMQPNEPKKVTVEIKLQHRETIYIVSREQEYRRDYNGKVKSSPTRLSVCFKGKDGQQEFVTENLVDSKVKEILPSELSGYFFFNGERIEKMSKEIQSGRSPEFASAVKRLLGLDTFTDAMKHLKGERAGKTTVIGYYNGQYDSSSDARIGEYTRQIEQKEGQLAKKTSRKEEIEDMLPKINDEIIRLNQLIASNKDSEGIKSRISSYERRIDTNNGLIGNSTSEIMQAFHEDYKFYFFQKPIVDALEMLSENEKIDKGIPDIHKRTIDFLIQRGSCICGTPISEDSPQHRALIELLDYIPPKSLGVMINEFVGACRMKTDRKADLFDIIKKRLADVTERANENDSLSKQIEALEEKITHFEDIGQYQRKIATYREDYKKKQSELAVLNQEIGALNTEIERAKTERSKLSLKNENNRKIELYRAYAERVYEILKRDYAQQEEQTRTDLENCINEIFKKIYNGGIELKIDEKYNVTTIVKDFSEFNIGVETSTAQSISIIFAFIAGVIKMARNKQNDEVLSTEAYPLVMDAPLSAFDKTRIQTVCDTLPNIAEQVIIFIKDTDGEIAETYLSSKIGKSYLFEKKNEFESYIVER